MEFASRKNSTAAKNGIIGGSSACLDSRRKKMDQGNGGLQVYRRLRRNQIGGGSTPTDKKSQAVIERRKPAVKTLTKSRSDSHSSACTAPADVIQTIRKTKSNASAGKADGIQKQGGRSTNGSDSHSSSSSDDDDAMICSRNSSNVGQQIDTTSADNDDKKAVVEEEIKMEDKSSLQVNVLQEVEVMVKIDNNKDDDDNYDIVVMGENASAKPAEKSTSYPPKDPHYTESPLPPPYELTELEETQHKFQSVVMWKDVSKSTFVFGSGLFIILSSSFTKDLNFSMISATSYMGLFYLAAIFFYKATLRRGNVELNQKHLVGEDDAIWLLRLIIPYLNAFLFKFKSLFSGDPATTLLLAVILFVLARCGNSITIWMIVKLGFIGIFIVPKVSSSYSSQISSSSKFWIRRFRDAWDSCSHKKVVAFVIFTLVWNLFSLIARIWAGFMLIVAIRYYQQQSVCVVREVYQENEKDDGKYMHDEAYNDSFNDIVKRTMNHGLIDCN